MTLRLSPWLRASLQGTTLLGVAMIMLVWTATTIYLESGKQADLKSATQEASNLARAFEEHIARTIRGTDNTLTILRSMYETDNKSFGFIDWASEVHLTNDTVLHYSIVNASGKLIESSRKPVDPLDLSDREHFRFQKNAKTDELFIGRPVDGLRSGKATIQLARRLRGWDGSFAGEIVASLDTAQLIKFYQTIDIGREGSISLIGLDGYVRARRGFKNENIVKLPPNRGVLQHLDKSPVGTYMNDGKFDGVLRLISYRTVAGLPLAVVVGLAQDEVLANYYANRLKYYGLAAGITFLILIVMALSIVHQRKLDKAYDWLRKSEMFLRASRQELKTTLDNIDQGILMVDQSGHVLVINRRIIDILDLPREWLSSKPSLNTILNYLRDRGEFGDKGEGVRSDIWELLKKGGLSADIDHYERTRPNGTVLEVRTRPLPDGGIVRTFTDVTERKRAEAKIAELATHDDLTGLANRKLFRDHIQRALGRAQRYGESFSVLLFDLDRFKEINDSRGHPAGDAVLREAACRLSTCVREHDTVARLGGDEFAILQAKTRTDEEAAQLAERIVQAIRAPFYLDGEEIALATSIGIALAPRDGADYEELVKKADEALYRAKEAGGNLFCFHRSGFMPQNKAGEVVDFVRAVS
jgi:diguanylate cyclase (GGDEF)-like protein